MRRINKTVRQWWSVLVRRRGPYVPPTDVTVLLMQVNEIMKQEFIASAANYTRCLCRLMDESARRRGK